MVAADPRTVADLLESAALADPDGTALVEGTVEGTRRLSRQALQERVAATAAGYARAGLTPGDRIVVQVASGVDFVACYLAGSRAGLVVVPVNPAYTLPELRHALSDSAAAGLITASVAAVSAVDELRRDLPALRQFVVAGPAAPEGAIELADLTADAPPVPAVEVDPEATAVLLYTSGTSGVPKGAMLSHRALLANLEQIARIDPPLIAAEDVALVPLPLFHGFGLNAGLGLALHSRATLVTSERFDPSAALELVRSEQVTMLLGAPAMFAALAGQPDVAETLAGVRFALSGSAPLSVELVERYAELGVALHEGYGLSETAPVVTLNLVDAAGHARIGHPVAGSIGVPIPGVELSLLDVDGEPVDDGDPGQVAVRGANLFTGYWPDSADGPDEDGWFVTGDIAYADGNGELFLVGRETEMVLVNGFNVYPAEVEAVLRESADVADVAVIGVPDETTGEAVRAYLVPATGVRVDPDAVLADAARSLARFKLPTQVEIVDSLPLTVTGKVKKWQLTQPEE